MAHRGKAYPYYQGGRLFQGQNVYPALPPWELELYSMVGGAMLYPWNALCPMRGMKPIPYTTSAPFVIWSVNFPPYLGLPLTIDCLAYIAPITYELRIQLTAYYGGIMCCQGSLPFLTLNEWNPQFVTFVGMTTPGPAAAVFFPSQMSVRTVLWTAVPPPAPTRNF